MATDIITLRDILIQKKPYINCTAERYQSTKNPKTWPNLNSRIRLWTEFTIGTLEKRFGGILDTELPKNFTVPQAKEELKDLTIHEVKDVKTIISWNASVLEPALQVGQSELELPEGIYLKQEHSAPRIPYAKTQTRVDHLVSVEDAPSRILVVGLGTTSKKFEGNSLLSAIEQGSTSRHENLISQLAHACNLSNARYGYLQTDKELVACRFSRKDEVWEADVMPIPMRLCKRGVMTTGLALWWMVMLALPGKDDSDIRPRKKMAPLDGSPTAKELKGNRDPQASVADPDGNPGQMASPSLPGVPNMGHLDTGAGVGGVPNPASCDADFASVPNMGLLNTNAGVGGYPNSASFNGGFPSFTNTGPADNSIGNTHSPDLDFSTFMQLSNYTSLEDEMDIDEP